MADQYSSDAKHFDPFDVATLMRAKLSRRGFLGRSALAAGAVAGAGALLDACSTSSSGKTTLNVMYNSGEMTKKHIAAFQQANPDIIIKYSEFDPIKFAASIAAGNPPDFVRGQGVSQTPNLVARNLMADLSGRFASSSVLKESDLDPINDAWRYDAGSRKQGTGARYGMTKDWSLDYALWYDKRAFDKAGVPYLSATTPITYDDLLDISKALTIVENGKIKQYGMDWEFADFGIYHQIQQVAQLGGSLLSADLRKIDFTTDAAKEAMNYWYKLAQLHVSPSPLDPADNWEWPLMQSGRLAIVQFGYWFGGEVVTDTNGLGDHVGFAPAPIMKGGTQISLCASATGSWIPAASKHQDAAWKLMEFFHGNDAKNTSQPAHERAKSGFGLPALKSLYSELPQAQTFQQNAYQTVQSEKSAFKVLDSTPYATPDAMSQAMANAFEPVIRNQTPFSDGMKNITNTINLLLTQGLDQIG